MMGGAGFLWWRARRPGASGEAAPDDARTDSPAPAPTAVPVDHLRARAGSLLRETAHAVGASAEEIGAVRAAGSAAASLEPYTQAVEKSRAEVDRALLLHDGGPASGDEHDERAWLEEIVALCESAGARLDALVDRFDAARGLDTGVGTLLSQLAMDVDIAQERIATSREAVADLGAQYPDIALAQVTANLGVAQDRVRFADEAVTASRTLLEDEDRKGAAAEARAAEAALAQAGTLLDGIAQVGQDLARAARAVHVLLEETEGGLAEAERLGVPDEISHAHPYAQGTVQWARSEADTGTFDPMAMRRALEDTDSALEVGLAAHRDEPEVRRRALALLGDAAASAQYSIRVAGCFIATRQGAVGLAARTHLLRAEQHHDRGAQLAADDPKRALTEHQRADALADLALRLGQQDEAARINEQRIAGTDPILAGAVAGGIIVPVDGPDVPAGSWAPVGFGGPRTRSRRLMPDPG